MSEWSRQHDALIAERAEGLKVIWVGSIPFYEDQQWGRILVDHYLTDLAASARAQESWRLQEPEFRSYSVEACGGSVFSECKRMVDGMMWRYRYESVGIEAPARAWALLRALKEGEECRILNASAWPNPGTISPRLCRLGSWLPFARSSAVLSTPTHWRSSDTWPKYWTRRGL